MPGPSEDPNREMGLIASALSKGRNRIEKLVIKGNFREKHMRCLKKGLTHRNNRVLTLDFAGTNMTVGALRVLQETVSHPYCRIRALHFTQRLPNLEETRQFKDVIVNSAGKIEELRIGPRSHSHGPRTFQAMTQEDARFISALFTVPDNAIKKLRIIRAVTGDDDEHILSIIREGLRSPHSKVQSLIWEQDPLHNNAMLELAAIVSDARTSVTRINFRDSGPLSFESYRDMYRACRYATKVQRLEDFDVDFKGSFLLSLYLEGFGEDYAQHLLRLHIRRMLLLVHSNWFRTMELLVVAFAIRPQRQTFDDDRSPMRRRRRVLLPVELIRMLATFLPTDEPFAYRLESDSPSSSDEDNELIPASILFDLSKLIEQSFTSIDSASLPSNNHHIQ